MIQIPSIFIPRVSNNHDEKYIERIFWQLFGCYASPIDHIDLVQRTDENTGYIFYMAFVFFRTFRDDEIIYNLNGLNSLKRDIEDNVELTITHSYPWFWKLYKNTGKKYKNPGGGQKRIISEEDEKEIREEKKKLFSKKIFGSTM